jgi:hypothetical protein
MMAAIMLLASAPTLGCDLADMTGARAVHDALGRRAVKIMGAAATLGPNADAVLDDLIDPSADFNLVIGDMGSPGTGVAGARSFAKAIRPTNTCSLAGTIWTCPPILAENNQPRWIALAAATSVSPE